MSKETKALKDLKRAYDKALEQSREHEFREYLNLQRLDKAEKKIEELQKENEDLEVYLDIFKLSNKTKQETIDDFRKRVDKAVAIIQNDTTLNPQRQRERLINTLTGGDE